MAQRRPDAPAAADRQRLRAARFRAHRRVREIDHLRKFALRAAFREELGATIRSASPFLIALLAIEGRTLDENVPLIAPHPGWPLRPRLSRRSASGSPCGRHLFRHYVTGLFRKREIAQSFPKHGHGYTIDRVQGGWFRVEVVDHSLEVTGQIGRVRFETRFGELRIGLGRDMPNAVALACIGRMIEEVVDHEALRGRQWRIIAVEGFDLGQVLVVEAPSVAYRMPWVTP